MSTSFKVLTYNTHLFIGSPAVFFAETFKKIGLVAQDCLRCQTIVNQIAEASPDVVCLQEVWAPAMQECLKGQLEQCGYQYSYIPPNTATDSHFVERVADSIAAILNLSGLLKNALEELLSAVPSLVDLLTASSGLLVASRYPLSDPTFKMYPDDSPDGSDDDLSKKGVATFTISLPTGAEVRTLLSKTARDRDRRPRPRRSEQL